jgi:hypothetical protein
MTISILVAEKATKLCGNQSYLQKLKFFLG